MIQESEGAPDQSPHCSFCKKSEAEVGHLVGRSPPGGPPVAICADCVELCSSILEQEKQTLELPSADPADAAALAATLSHKIDEAVKSLDDLEFRIIELRYGLADGHSHSHEEVAKALAITPERVQAIEAGAVAKLTPPS